jgi:hypothetical protein
MNIKNRIICRIVAYKSFFKVIGEKYAKELFNQMYIKYMMDRKLIKKEIQIISDRLWFM